MCSWPLRDGTLVYPKSKNKLVLRKTGRLVLFTDGAAMVYCLHSNSVIISNYLFKYFYRQMFIFA